MPATASIGDLQILRRRVERLRPASVHLLFFALELNRVDDATIERAMQTPELAHYRPWIEDLRKDKPYQLRGSRRAAVS
jgi:oligoendopeptidase F